MYSVLAALTIRQGAGGSRQGSLVGRRQKLIDLAVFGEQRVKNGLRPFAQLHRVEDERRLAQVALAFSSGRDPVASRAFATYRSIVRSISL